MRISDWSSDVCSSDLWAEPLLFLPRHLRTLVDAEPRRGSPREFKHRRHLAAAHHRFERFGDSVFGDAVDAAVGADEDHVERDQRILHPETADSRLFERKHNPAILGQAGAEPQTAVMHGDGARAPELTKRAKKHAGKK